MKISSKNMLSRFMMIIFAVGFLTACEGHTPITHASSTSYSEGKQGMTKDVYAAAEALLNQAKEKGLISETTPMVVATFSDISESERAAPLGRVVAEQMGTRLVQQGYNLAEVNLRESININADGQFLTTRDQTELNRIYNVAAIITGQYARGEHGVHFTSRMVSAADGRVIAAHDFILPYNSDIRALMRRPTRSAGSQTGNWFNTGDAVR